MFFCVTVVNGTGGVLVTILSVLMLLGAPITRKKGNELGPPLLPCINIYGY